MASDRQFFNLTQTPTMTTAAANLKSQLGNIFDSLLWDSNPQDVEVNAAWRSLDLER
jgi:hypothetical protein